MNVANAPHPIAALGEGNGIASEKRWGRNRRSEEQGKGEQEGEREGKGWRKEMFEFYTHPRRTSQPARLIGRAKQSETELDKNIESFEIFQWYLAEAAFAENDEEVKVRRTDEVLLRDSVDPAWRR